MATVVIAAPITASKTAETELTVSEREILVGENTDLSAATEKKGSSYQVTWSSNQEGIFGEGETVKTDEGYYVSTNNYTANEAGDHTLSYSITMTAGKSHVSWTASDSETIKVIAPVEEGKNSKDKEKSNNGVGTGSKENPSLTNTKGKK